MTFAPIRAAAVSPPALQALMDSSLADVLALLLGMGGFFFIILLAAAGFSWLHRFEERPHEFPKRLQAELEAIRRRLARVEEGGSSVTALEERLEFVERLLNQTRGAPRLPPPDSTGQE